MWIIGSKRVSFSFWLAKFQTQFLGVYSSAWPPLSSKWHWNYYHWLCVPLPIASFFPRSFFPWQFYFLSFCGIILIFPVFLEFSSKAVRFFLTGSSLQVLPVLIQRVPQAYLINVACINVQQFRQNEWKFVLNYQTLGACTSKLLCA